MSAPPMHRIVKVGGSLLTRPEFSEALRAWYQAQTPARTMMVFGGGQLIDAIRRRDRLCPGDPDVVHWQCVELLQKTFEVVIQRLADWPVIDKKGAIGRDCWSELSTRQPTLLSIRSFYDRDSQTALPTNWDTTTDSIAAELARQTDADELVLLKSCDIDPSEDIATLTKKGIVDAAFAQFATDVQSIRIEKLP